MTDIDMARHRTRFLEHLGPQFTIHGPLRAPVKRRLFRRIAPHHDESLRGLIARACKSNHVDHTFGVMKFLGQAHRNRFRPAEDHDIATSDLAAMLTAKDETIERLRYPHLEGRNRAFFGTAVHQDRIETRVRRFSPAFLALAPYHRAQWELKDLPFCSIGWDILLDRCPCHHEVGLVQGWIRTVTRVDACDRCGSPLSALPSITVPKELRDVLEFVAGLVDTDPWVKNKSMARLPVKITSADPGKMFSVIARMAGALETAGPYFPSPHNDHSIEALHEAGLAVLNWPDGLEKLNSRIERSSRSLRLLLSDYAELGESNHGYTPLIDASLSWTMASDRYLAAKPASHLVNLCIQTLADIWQSGLVTKHYRRHGSRLVPAFDKDEIMLVANKWHARVSAHELAIDLDIDLHGVEQLAALAVVPATGIKIPGTGPYFEQGVGKSLFEKLALVAESHPIDGRSVTLAEVMDFIGGRRKPWGPVIAKLLSGQVAFELDDGSGMSLSAIRVAERHAAALTRLAFEQALHPGVIFADHVNQQDALACLNASVQRSHLLAGLDAKGTVPKLYLAKDLELLAARIITTAEIAKRLDMNCATAHAYVRNAGLKAIGKGAFLRDDFETLIAERTRRIILRLKNFPF